MRPGFWLPWATALFTVKENNAQRLFPPEKQSLCSKVKPVYEKLSEDSLLNKCLHGKTQNQNEAISGMVWKGIPKEVFFGMEMLEFGLFDAISHFNIRAIARTVLVLLRALKINPGKYT